MAKQIPRCGSNEWNQSKYIDIERSARHVLRDKANNQNYIWNIFVCRDIYRYLYVDIYHI